MHPMLAEKRDALVELCRRYGVRDAQRSDADLLVELRPEADYLASFPDFQEAVEMLLGRIRRHQISSESKPLCAA